MYGELQNRFYKAIKGITNLFLGIIGVLHQYTHEGKVFTASKRFAGVLNDAYADFRMITGADKKAHIEVFIQTEGKAYIDSYSGTTYTGNGTIALTINRDTSSANTNTAVVYHTPTVNVLGSARFEQLSGGGTNPTNQIAGSTTERVETVLDVNTDLLVRVQNKAGSAKDISIYAIWYEV